MAASSESWASAWGGAGPGLLRSTVGPLLLLVSCPSAVQLIGHTVKNLDGSLGALLADARDDPFGLLQEAFPAPTCLALNFLVGLLLLQLSLLVVVPGLLHRVRALRNRAHRTRGGRGWQPSPHRQDWFQEEILQCQLQFRWGACPDDQLHTPVSTNVHVCPRGLHPWLAL